MHHLIIGYGYTGFHLARYLINQQETVTAVSRHLDESQIVPGVEYIQHDIQTPFPWSRENTLVYYLIPPPATGRYDTILQTFLNISTIKPAKFIYFGSSAVYGDKSGELVGEETPCTPVLDRQYRRLDAERQCMTLSKAASIDCILLRIGGIFGPYRLPVEAALQGTPVIETEFAPTTNLIYVKDLVRIAALLAMKDDAKGIYNVSDGLPEPMGTLQQQTATLLKLPAAPFQSMEQALAQASPMKREFIQASKRLRIDALQMTLGQSFALTPKLTAIKESLQEEGKLP